MKEFLRLIEERLQSQGLVDTVGDLFLKMVRLI